MFAPVKADGVRRDGAARATRIGRARARPGRASSGRAGVSFLARAPDAEVGARPPHDVQRRTPDVPRTGSRGVLRRVAETMRPRPRPPARAGAGPGSMMGRTRPWPCAPATRFRKRPWLSREGFAWRLLERRGCRCFRGDGVCFRPPPPSVDRGCVGAIRARNVEMIAAGGTTTVLVSGRSRPRTPV